MRRAAVIAFFCWSACAVAVPSELDEREPESCGRVVLSAVPPPRRRVDLVLSVNGEVCRREPLYAGWRGRITRMCGPEWFAPGDNRVELSVDPPGCGRPVARRAVRCWLPEPD
jgi:hypothetical protein